MIRGLAVFGSLIAVLLSGHPAPAAEPQRRDMAPEPAVGVQATLERIPGMRVVDAQGFDGGAVFRLSYRQPVDHQHPGRGSFRQRLVLIHVNRSAPMVLQTTGYDLPYKPEITEPTTMLGANQVSVEQRYFLPSRPDPARWRHLTITQAAADHHRIVTALKPIYPQPWISTGASKGGMASVYHRRFYPDDLAGTVAYVAPNDVRDREDRYQAFIDRAGQDRSCNRGLRVLQREALERRATLLRMLRTLLRHQGHTVTRTYGSLSRSFEATVLATPFTFWTYYGSFLCSEVPGGRATDRQVFDFIAMTADWTFGTDQGLRPYEAYYFQAAHELGAPAVGPDSQHLRGLLRHPRSESPRWAIPARLRTVAFRPAAMRRIDAWVRSEGSRLLFVYGEDDPWSAEPFRFGRGSRDSARFFVAEGNHGSSIWQLGRAERRRAERMVLRWGGIERRPALPAGFAGLTTEAENRMRVRLR